MKLRPRLIGGRPSFEMVSDNLNVELRFFDCTLYTHHHALKDDYQRTKSLLFYNSVEYNYIDTLAKTFMISIRQTHVFKENIFSNALVL